jgi:beta-lactamase superfamily II metal-dependent hydrolase
MTYQNTSLLFTGDVQADAEAQMVSKYGSKLQADVLKVGHHGSSGSSSAAFLNMVKPKAAYISVGKGNSYGHPTQAALSRLQAAGAAVYRTDLSGTQEYTIGGNAYTGPLHAPSEAGAYSPD